MFKTLKTITGECPICEDIKKLSYGARVEALKINNQNIHVKTNVYRCEEEHHFFYNPADEEEKFQEAYRKYRELNGLLQPEDIKEIREKYGLSQRALARFLGWGEITVQRYESGALQSNAHNFLLLLMKDTINFEKLFEIRKNMLSVNDVRKINKHLDIIKQLTLFSTFKKSKAHKMDSNKLAVIQRLQSLGDYKYRKPVRTVKGELALAS
jgi:putative zinc finger/helix-turn-helix YgiT family protein